MCKYWSLQSPTLWQGLVYTQRKLKETCGYNVTDIPSAAVKFMYIDTVYGTIFFSIVII